MKSPNSIAYPLGLIALLVALVVYKIPHLALPYYWDEAWSYGTAIRFMEAKGLSLMPDALPPYFSRGHPLFFYFIGAAWMKIFGTSMVASHILPLIISILLVIATFYFGKVIFRSEKIGFIASFALLFQPLFVAQSGLLLPEVLLALLSFISIYFFLRKKQVAYLLSASIAVLTKETGIVVIATLLLWTLIKGLQSNEHEKWKNFFKKTAFISLPLLPFVAFLFIQRITNGWYFYPVHLSYISFNFSDFYERLENYFAYTFIYQGRNLLFFSALIAVAIIIIRKKPVEKEFKAPVFIMLLYAAAYLIFSSLNFFSNRYMLAEMPILVLLFSFCINTAFDYKWTLPVTMVVIFLLQVRQLNIHTGSDHNLGYTDVVNVHQQTVDYCIKHDLQDKNIYAYFLMEGNLKNPYCGYLSADKKFQNVTGSMSDSTEYYIFSNVEDKENYELLKNSGKAKLITRFEKVNAWSEIYRRMK